MTDGSGSAPLPWSVLDTEEREGRNMERYQLTEKEYKAVVALNARNHWGFSRRMLMDLLRRYRKAYAAGDVRKMAMYEERLTDANFHTEC